MGPEKNMSTVSMNGGDGSHSYMKNSSYQKEAVDGAKGIISEEIAKKLDIKHMYSSSSSKSFCIADLGCSVGPNTFIAVHNIIDAIKLKYKSLHSLGFHIPEFQVFFNDHISNDFNQLFASLAPHKPYFASAVPGSFYNRLFPKQSLHFVYSSYALQWLSKAPTQVEDVSSPAWNKGRIHFGDAPKEVVDAYSAQFVNDMESFLCARAEELVSGGLMALILPSYPERTLSTVSFPRPLDILGSCLMDLAKKGLLSEERVDSFNMPVYSPSAEEFEKAVKRNGCFSVERLELLDIATKSNIGFDAKTSSLHMRAGLEGVISEHFGTQILDELFVLFLEKVAELSQFYNSQNRFTADLFVLLKRQ